MKHHIIALLITFCGIIAYSQPTNKFTNDISVPTPEAGALGKYADIPVNLSNGSGSVSIPITTLKNGTVSTEISVNYHLAGIRLSEMASMVGLGWSLNAGGMISRSVLGIPDDNNEFGQGYYYSGSTLKHPFNEYNPTTPAPGDYTHTQNQVALSASGSMDSQPDVFSFNVGGYSGKFVFDKNQTIQFISKSDVKISIDAFDSNQFAKFKLIAPDGTIYYFGSTEKTNNVLKGVERTVADPYATVREYNTSWFLTKIESADGKYSINFQYKYQGALEFETNQTEGVYPYKNCLTCSSYGCIGTCTTQPTSEWPISVNKSFNKYYGWRISKIYTEIDSVIFVSNSMREDLTNAERLDEIQVKTASSDPTNNFCKKFSFGYSYMVSSGTAADNRKKRLILNSMTEKSCDGSIMINPYTFEYHAGTLPERCNYERDHWGFYNGSGPANKSSNFYGIPANPIFNYSGSIPMPWADGNRNPVESYTKIGILKTVKYPLGGKREIDVELNDANVNQCTTQQNTTFHYSLTTCSAPYPGASGSDCCINNSSPPNGINGYRMASGNYTHTTTNSPLKFKLTGFKVYPCGPNTSNSLVQVKVFYNNAQIGNTQSILVNPPPGTSAFVELPLSQLFSPVIGQTYQILLETWEYAKGDFNILSNADVTTCNEITKVVGGLRVKSIKSYFDDNDVNPIISNYTYKNGTKSSGILTKEPDYGGNLTYYKFGLNSNILLATKVYNESMAPLTNYNGNIVAYSHVQEIAPGNGKTEYRYYMESTGYDPGNNGIFPNHLPLSPEPIKIFESNLLSKTTYNEAGVILSSETNEYLNSGVYTAIPGICYRSEAVGDPAYQYNSVKVYQNKRSAIKLSKTTVFMDGVTTVTDFTFDGTDRFLMPISKSLTNSDGKVHREEYTYNHDYDNAVGLRDALVSKNIISSPFRTVIKVDGVHLDGPETVYSWYNLSTGVKTTSSSGSFPRPYQLFRYEKTFDASGNLLGTGGITLQTTIDAYDANGNVKQVTTPNWQPQIYDWYSNGRLKSTSFLNHKKEYTYYPGTRFVNNVIDIDGQYLTYEYDKLTRLSKTKARLNNVVTDYTYHYKEVSGDIYNWVKSTTTYTATANSSLTTRTTIDYLDGLGRSMQTVKKNHSPGSKDVVIGKVYDSRGRVFREYLPVESIVNTGAFFTIPAGTKYTETIYETSPLNRPISVTPPGTVGSPGSWYATTISYGANAGSDVSNLSTGSNYVANALSKVITTDPMNNRTIVFKDKKGREVMTWKTDVSYASHTRTYTMYDNKDRVTSIVPQGATLSTTPELTYKYTYDQDDKVLTKTIPGKGVEKILYNNRDLATFTQDAKWVAGKDWLHSKYDDYGRLLNNGRYTHSTTNDPSGDLNATYNDQYKEILYFTLLSDGVKLGKIKQTKDKILGTSNTWIQNDMNYDTYGRVSTITGSNHLYNNINAETINTTYDFADNVMTENRTHKPSVSEQQIINKRWTYDASGRVKDHFTSLNGAETKISNQNYNFRDEMSEKNLGATTASGINTYLQSLDYSYNDQGWLTKINQSTLGGTNIAFPTICTPAMPNPGVYTPAADPDPNDLFYLELNYDVNTTGITGLPTNVQKSGNIAQIAWRVRGRDRQAYNYTYDFLNRMSSSTYYDVSAANAATVSNRYNESLTYDLRGNILTMNRTGYYTDAGGCLYNTIDNLTYNYAANTNKLTSITDASATAPKPKGFNPGSGGAGFGYDLVGNLKSDTYKGITDITYNYLNLPESILWGSSKSILFSYDASGNKLSKIVKTGTTTNLIQDYVSGVEYNSPSGINRKIEAIYHAEGRYFNTSITTTPAWRTEYSIKDHLGNARISFTDKNLNGVIDVTTNSGTNEILQENHFYAFGMTYDGPWMINDVAKDNPYQYNGKELNLDHGLNWSDYGARWYDACVGRWSCVDAWAEDYNSWSPYNYTMNNPLRFIDPTGNGVENEYVKDKNSGKTVQVSSAGNDEVDIIHRGTINDDGSIVVDPSSTQVVNVETVSNPNTEYGGVRLPGLNIVPGANPSIPTTSSPIDAIPLLVSSGGKAALNYILKEIKDLVSNPAKPKDGSSGGPGAGKNFSERTKDAAESQAGGRCVFCKNKTDRTPGSPNRRNTDHADPKSKGGNNTLENAQNTCVTCNQDKGVKTTQEYLKYVKGKK